MLLGSCLITSNVFLDSSFLSCFENCWPWFLKFVGRPFPLVNMVSSLESPSNLICNLSLMSMASGSSKLGRFCRLIRVLIRTSNCLGRKLKISKITNSFKSQNLFLVNAQNSLMVVHAWVFIFAHWNELLSKQQLSRPTLPSYFSFRYCQES